MPHGILLLDKPQGLSSNGALQRVRALYGREKAGHVGSLDPLATGMLPICLGEATKVAGDLVGGRKCYRFTVTLGAATATGDAAGAITATAPVPGYSQAEIEAVLGRFLGPQQQVPPMYSALKQAGEPLYRLARAGRTVERPSRRIELFSLALADAPGANSLDLQTLCSKGTYVRVLAEDIARALGTCGHVTALRRLYVEPFAEVPMLTLDKLSVRAAACTLPPLLPPDCALGHLPAVHLTAASSQRVLHGERVAADLPGGAARVRLYDESGEFLGVGEADGSGGVQPRRLLRREVAARGPGGPELPAGASDDYGQGQAGRRG